MDHKPKFLLVVVVKFIILLYTSLFTLNAFIYELTFFRGFMFNKFNYTKSALSDYLHSLVVTEKDHQYIKIIE